MEWIPKKLYAYCISSPPSNKLLFCIYSWPLSWQFLSSIHRYAEPEVTRLPNADVCSWQPFLHLPKILMIALWSLAKLYIHAIRGFCMYFLLFALLGSSKSFVCPSIPVYSYMIPAINQHPIALPFVFMIPFWVQLNIDSRFFSGFVLLILQHMLLICWSAILLLVMCVQDKLLRSLERKLCILLFRLLLNGPQTKDILLNPN